MMAIERYYLDELELCAAMADLPRSTVLAALRFLAVRGRFRYTLLVRRFTINRNQAWWIIHLMRHLHLSWFCIRRRVYRVERGAFRRVLELGALVEREGLNRVV